MIISGGGGGEGIERNKQDGKEQLKPPPELKISLNMENNGKTWKWCFILHLEATGTSEEKDNH